MILLHDIVLDDTAFASASNEMAKLKVRTEALKARMEKMYAELTTALDTPAGKEIQITAEKVLIEPIDKMLLVIGHISDTLAEIIANDTKLYSDVFVKFEELNDSIKFN